MLLWRMDRFLMSMISIFLMLWFMVIVFYFRMIFNFRSILMLRCVLYYDCVEKYFVVWFDIENGILKFDFFNVFIVLVK